MDQQRAGPQSLHGGDVVGGYRIVERIGQGGMGDVFRAWDDRLHRAVAIKVPRVAASFDDVSRRRFLRETRVACRVTHPYVATVYDVIEERGQPYLVMEFIEGTGFDEVLRHQQLATDVIARYSLEIAEALAAIHAEGIVHRDLKPANVMLTRAGHVKVMDFGVALPSAVDSTSGDPEATLTRDGSAVGTIQYMSPEQIAGRRPDPRSDLFALGIVLYEAITREHPFVRGSPLAIATAIASDAPGGGTEPPTLTKSGPLRHVVMKLLEKDPDARYESAESLIADLRAVIAGAPLPSLEQSRRPAPRRSLVPAVMGIVVVAAVAGILVWRWRTKPVEETQGPRTGVSRPVIAVLPLEDRIGDLDGALRAQMITELLAASLGDSPVARSLSSRRVSDLLEGAPSPRVRAEEIARVRKGSIAKTVVGGTLYPSDSGFRAALDYYAAGSDEPVPIQLSAVSAPALVDVAAARLRALLDPSGGASTGSGVAAYTSENDDARLLEQRARRALRESRYNEAIAFLENAVEIDPQFVSAYTMLGDTADRAGYGRKAKEAAERAVRLCDAAGDRMPPRLDLAARATYARVNERLDAELEARRQLADRFPDDPDVLVAYASCLRRKTPGEAWPVLERAVNLDPLDPRSYILRGRLQSALKRGADAEASWGRAEELFQSLGSPSGAAEVGMARGTAAYAKGDYTTAAQRYAAAASVFERAALPALVANARKSEADARNLLGDTAAALPLYEQAAALGRQVGNLRVTLSALEGLSAGWYVAGRYTEAERRMRECVDDARRTENQGLLVVPLANLANLLVTTRQPAEALVAGEEAASLGRDLHDAEAEALAEMTVADALYQTGKIGDARRRYESLIPSTQEAAKGRDASVQHSALAQIELETGHLASARDHAARSLSGFRQQKRATQIEGVLLTEARVLAELDLRSEAKADLDEVAAHLGAGTQRPARLALARSFAARSRGDFDEARRQLAAIKLTPAEQASSGLAPEIENAWCALEWLGPDAKAAVATCRRAVDDRQSMATERAAARARLALGLWRLGRRDEALGEARRAVAEAAPLDAPPITLFAQRSLQVTSAGRDARDQASRSAQQAMDAYLEAAPPERREAIRHRPDLIAIERALDSEHENGKTP